MHLDFFKILENSLNEEAREKEISRSRRVTQSTGVPREMTLEGSCLEYPAREVLNSSSVDSLLPEAVGEEVRDREERVFLLSLQEVLEQGNQGSQWPAPLRDHYVQIVAGITRDSVMEDPMLVQLLGRCMGHFKKECMQLLQ